MYHRTSNVYIIPQICDNLKVSAVKDIHIEDDSFTALTIVYGVVNDKKVLKHQRVQESR